MYEDLFSGKGLSHQRLYTLVLLGEHGTMIKAAGGDEGRQSRLSHQMKELSEYFGAKLTEKTGRGIRLTPAGEELAKLAREHFAGLAGFRQQVRKQTATFQVGAGDSLSQKLVVPAIGLLRRDGQRVRIVMRNLRSEEIVGLLTERRLDFGVVRKDAIDSSLKTAAVGQQRYAIFIPRRLSAGRGSQSLSSALLEVPHAAVGGEGALVKKLQDLAERLGGAYQPELTCDSIGQCVAAVASGSFAAVLPVNAMPLGGAGDCDVVEDSSLETLTRNIVLSWHPGTIALHGLPAKQFQQKLAEALRQVGKSL